MRLLATIALLAIGLGTPALAETSVGVTAAVNQDATGTVGSNVKTISLGDSVVFNQRIQTGGSGLVQVLLADGTTFMVGPNSDLVIDSFVYDPSAGTAQVTASFTKGVLRFIGGQTSKTEGGVTINTPVGTMGIRGAMVDVVLDPPDGTPPHVDMLFGNEVTLEQGQELLGRLYAAGYSLALGPNGTFDVLKTPPGWGSQIQAALAGKLGTKGGAPKGPNDDDVKNSEVAGNNSGNGANKNSGPKGLTKEELDALLYAAAHYDELRNFLLNNRIEQGFVGGVFTGEPDDECFYDCSTPNAPGVNDYDATWGEQDNPLTYTPTFANLAFNLNGDPVAIKAGFLAGIGGECEENCDVDLTYEGILGSGRLFATIEDQLLEVQTANNVLYSHDDERVDNPLNVELDPENDPGYTLADQLECNDCAGLVKWGFWGFTAEGVQVGDVTDDIDFLGTWITGDLTTRAQMANLAAADEGNFSASYSGDAVGVVYNADAGEGGSRYVATGDMDMTWNFGQRQGTVDISNFDSEHLNDNLGMDIHYDVGGPTDGGNGFLGFTGGEGSYGVAQGAFVNSDSAVAAGVIGNWSYAQEGYYPSDYPGYSVGGVFMGTQNTN
jgi:hypothetical protein